VTPLFALLFDSLDERLRLRRPSKQALTKVFPHHWTFLFGEVALFAFIVLVLTGIFLTMFYVPSVEPVTYTGSLELYQGRELPAAYESIVRLTYDVPGGLLFRRIHRGAAYVFVTAIVLHLIRVLLTGAFRRPREVNYHVGLLLLMLGLGLVGTGQFLPYDVVEGAALRIGFSFMLAIPFIGDPAKQLAALILAQLTITEHEPFDNRFTARDPATGRIVRFNVGDAALRSTLKVGQVIWLDHLAGLVGVNPAELCCGIIRP
jgi:ubiquinol-cytochrome c reductase cytochrome b subunit